VEGVGGLLSEAGGRTFRELYDSHLDWLIRSRKIPLETLLDFPVETLEEMLKVVADHEDAVNTAIRNRRR
jgi:hypothetical protein